MKKIFLPLILFLATLGFLDASYLTWEHFNSSLPPCSIHWWVDCGKVLSSVYSQFWGIPVAALGMVQYLVVFGLAVSLVWRWRQKVAWWLLIQTTIGLLFSVYFVIIQLLVLQAICLYCMGSALISTTLFGLSIYLISDKRGMSLWLLSLKYQVLKQLLFLFNPEIIHESMVHFGEKIGRISWLTAISNQIFNPPHPALVQKIAGLTFTTPIGLAAGFDYEARLTQILYSLGFGFQTVGTISNQPCEGNARPRLGRLPRSKSLLVNKGFRNPGATAITKKLTPLTFHNQVGVSIGQTNGANFQTQSEVIDDILSAFRQFEQSQVSHNYYELNISCPNLHSDFNFYNPKNLTLLLTKIDALKLKRPVFVKMPISESDEVILSLLKVIAKHSPVGVIIGNLQKDRLDPAVQASERDGLGKGNLSGKPTFARSNHLIALVYQHFHPRLIIVGCGGVFSAEDAYLKISLGASLIQIITGMVFQGPQLVAQINQGLTSMLKENGFTSLPQAVGSAIKK